MQGASEAGLASFPPVDAAFAAMVKTPTLSGLVKDPACPNKQCKTTEIHLKKGYLTATEAVRLSNVASLLSVYQASLVKDLPEHPSTSLRAELALVTQLLVKIAQLNARAQGRSIASLVAARRQLWLSQVRVHELDKAPLLNAPITPGHTFGPAVEVMLQRSVKAREASQQMAKMWPHKPFQPRRQQEHQWHRSAEGGALEVVAGHALEALASPLANEPSLNSPEISRQLLTHPYTVPQLLFWQQCTSDIWVRKTIFTGYGHTFGPAVEEMLQRSVKAREASQQLAKMWPSKPFQPRRPQERQWRRAPPQQQAQSRGSMTAPSGVSARGQPAFVRPQRGGWRPRGGGKPRPRGSGQAPRERAQPKQP
ncbi:UNVERIFIED_CONTAM: hypothetical protein FKN15_011144 [Acipenser sinensis]